MTYHVQLRTSEVSRYTFEGRAFFRVDVEVIDTYGGIPEEIFMWRKTPYDAISEETHDEFQGVCSVYDLTTYPANAPNASQTPPFYRRNLAVIKGPGITVVDEAVELLRQMVDALCGLLTKAETLSVIDEAWHPSEPPV